MVGTVFATVAILKGQNAVTERYLCSFRDRGLAVIGMHKFQIRTRKQLFTSVAKGGLPGRIEMFEVAVSAGNAPKVWRELEKLAQVITVGLIGAGRAHDFLAPKH